MHEAQPHMPWGFKASPEYQEVARWHDALQREYGLKLILGSSFVEGSSFSADTQAIYLGVRCATPLACYLHAFAHAVQASQGTRVHDAAFYAALVPLLRRVYGDPAAYAWAIESLRVQKWAYRDGWLPTAPAALTRGKVKQPPFWNRYRPLCYVIADKQGAAAGRAGEIPESPALRDVVHWHEALSQEYGVTATLHFPRGKGGQYRPVQKRIIVRTGNKNPLDVFIHEFAHALNSHRKTGKRHDAAFYQCLREVARRVYGDEAQYGWDDDYRRIANWAFRDGLLKEKPLTRREAYSRRNRIIRIDEAGARTKSVSPFGVVTGGQPFRGDEDHAVIIKSRYRYLRRAR